MPWEVIGASWDDQGCQVHPVTVFVFSSMSCMHEIKGFLVQCFSTSSCFYTEKSTFQPIVSKTRVCEM